MISEVLQFLIDLIYPIIIIANIIFALTVVFIERKNPTATIAWLMVLFLLPVIGFILYLFIGQTFHRDRMFRVKKEYDETMTNLIESQKRSSTATSSCNYIPFPMHISG